MMPLQEIRVMRICFPVVLLILITKVPGSNAQSRPPIGLQRSNSDTSFNRNHTFHRQSSLQRNDRCSINYKFDYIQLSLIWPPGSCSTSPQECQREENKHFTVHGMWPTIKNTQEPSFCCFDNTFDWKTIESSKMFPDLKEYWYAFYGSSSRGFWAHEWLKHGTCSRDVPSLRGELRYFNTTVQIAKQLPILESLKKFNIVPSNDKPYNSMDIVKALMPIAQGHNFQIDCDYEHNQPIPIMTGVNFCYDSSLKTTDCPEMKRRCQRQVFFRTASKRVPRPAYL